MSRLRRVTIARDARDTAFRRGIPMSAQLKKERAQLFGVQTRDKYATPSRRPDSERRYYIDIDESNEVTKYYVTDEQIADAHVQILLLQDKLRVSIRTMELMFNIKEASLVNALSCHQGRVVKYWKQIQSKLKEQL